MSKHGGLIDVKAIEPKYQMDKVKKDIWRMSKAMEHFFFQALNI